MEPGLRPVTLKRSARPSGARGNKHIPTGIKWCILPVTGEYSKTTDARTGNPVRTLVRVMNAFDLSSVRLEGGATGQVDLSVVYSRFKK